MDELLSQSTLLPFSVVGYHGCNAEVAQRLIEGDSFLPSRNDYDWLGEGVYFWEYAPHRAIEWAGRLYGADAAVVSATVQLGFCLNLLDTQFAQGLREAYDRIVKRAELVGANIPANDGKAHRLDRAIVEFYCQDFGRVSGKLFQSVRGCFPEGGPVYPGSRILRETHIQIAVRDVSCISDVKRVTF